MAEFLEKIKLHKSLSIGIFLLLLFGFFLGAAIDGASQSMAKGERAQLEKGMQDAVNEHKEDLLRQQIRYDSSKKTELQQTITQFTMALNYDLNQISATVYEYGPENVSDANLANKTAVAEKFALQANELFSHLDGFMAFIDGNKAEFQRLGSDLNVTEGAERFSEAKAGITEAESQLALELETFAKSNGYKESERMQVVGDALALLRGETR
ncbi:hypothetical protein COU39_01145 [Candidatus Micrarchaeota archaeon CG10_big_fil_rev_8_21_14_0_10_60_32]|nr:MAG: hypothetical protein AUJ16_02420 [Candidatus Micrarchaeota archaeon CG1_02_60_51]PIN96472.1 MAG: hypothetical protein COU39_01145 [Candidatus Micrarchaeota archaeon CG10_big_fil_rev_8_21_14_0_10_60_32]PIO01753.1 MAG: hypothetical protein COT58_03500 [Candidatus Micrarchaeota archaeon CG09_land_8_20_14_0_10_60_16]